MDALVDAPRMEAVHSSAGLRVVRLSLAVLAGILYPISPRLLYDVASAPATPAVHLMGVAIGIAVVFAVPLAGVMLLWSSSRANDRHALQARGIGMLLVLAPVLRALGIGVSAIAGLYASAAVLVWIAFWAVAVLAVMLRSAVPRPLLPPAVNRNARRVHRTLIAVVALFVVVHLAVNLTALSGLDTYNPAAAAFRGVWRTSVGEPILITLLAMQLLTGLAMALDASIGRSTFEHLCQIAAGAVIGVFLTSHTLAVAVLGRRLLDRGPDFTFASGGPAGLFGSGQSAVLFPYYALGVAAVFVHLARPARLYVQRLAGVTPGRVASGALVAVGVVISTLLAIALVHPVAR